MSEAADDPIFEAIRSKNVKTVAELLRERPERVNAKGPGDLTPLHVAAAEDRAAVAKVLLSKGADVNAKDADGKTPLQVATAKTKVAKVLSDQSDRERKITKLAARLKGQPPARREETRTPDRGGGPSGGMVDVPAGWFVMGSTNDNPDEEPQRRVYLDAYRIDTYEVTVDDYAACVRAGKCSKPMTGNNFNWDVSGRGKHPINGVNWNQAVAFCKWKGKRLPTEAEWEKAARGTDGRKYPWGNQSPSCQRTVMGHGGIGCGKDRTWPVGSKPSGRSPYGAHDMAGNVWEWVADWYAKDAYSSQPERNPTGPSSGSDRVLRGGSCSSHGFFLRAAFRFDGAPGVVSSSMGLRCAR